MEPTNGVIGIFAKLPFTNVDFFGKSWNLEGRGRSLVCERVWLACEKVRGAKNPSAGRVGLIEHNFGRRQEVMLPIFIGLVIEDLQEQKSTVV